MEPERARHFRLSGPSGGHRSGVRNAAVGIYLGAYCALVGCFFLGLRTEAEPSGASATIGKPASESSQPKESRRAMTTTASDRPHPARQKQTRGQMTDYAQQASFDNHRSWR
jgi:hypothetical protein